MSKGICSIIRQRTCDEKVGVRKAALEVRRVCARNKCLAPNVQYINLASCLEKAVCCLVASLDISVFW